MPYLFVLESRAERVGKPDPNLVKFHLYEYILSAPLELLLPIFDASKPTLVGSQRIISDDEDIARLALSCLYGNTRVDSWSQMSRIFECLPAWSVDGVDTRDEDEVVVTMSSLASYLAPSTTQPQGTPIRTPKFLQATSCIVTFQGSRYPRRPLRVRGNPSEVGNASHASVATAEYAYRESTTRMGNQTGQDLQ